MEIEMIGYSSLLKISAIVLICFGCFSATVMAEIPGQIPNEVVEQILQNPKFTKYIHPEIKDRVPIVIQSNFVDPDINISLYEKRVIIESDSKKLKTTNIYMSFFRNGKVSVHYPVEGVKGIFEFVTDNSGNWKLKNCNVWEY